MVVWMSVRCLLQRLCNRDNLAAQAVLPDCIKLSPEIFRCAKTLKTRIKTMAADTATYTYDNLGRLKTVTFTNGTVITYNYDAAGNRTSIVTSCPGGTC
jgi:YD repeat-containing protein